MAVGKRREPEGPWILRQFRGTPTPARTLFYVVASLLVFALSGMIYLQGDSLTAIGGAGIGLLFVFLAYDNRCRMLEERLERRRRR